MKKFRKNIIEKLTLNGIELQEAVIEADWIFQKITGISKKDILINPEIAIIKKQKEKIDELVQERILTKKPIQYILKEAFFMGEYFFVDENVLIPRPETEILVNKSVEIIKKLNKNPSIVDIGTGSGCISCMIAKLTGKNIFAVDISEKALKIAKKNAKTIGVKDKITFLKSDILSNVSNKFDLIISNPPYIPISQKSNLQVEVSMHEPDLALFAYDTDGISFYEKIIKQSKQKLNPNGYIAFETGINQANKVNQFLLSAGFSN
ncbi:MAG: peptide chain release factor N(5)-glutamine methyltransferase, partial [Candidatus Gastranaerophilales bacterium]|nr:peptide chain release factor N(5)-glutamine methyltransferase [Candidatus Gastranaerophilales bacterium]